MYMYVFNLEHWFMVLCNYYTRFAITDMMPLTIVRYMYNQVDWYYNPFTTTEVS